MGTSQTKHKINTPSEKVIKGLKHKIKALQSEIDEIMRIRDSENEVYERELMVFAFKQAEWKKEKKRFKDELKKMRKFNFDVKENVQIEMDQVKRDETIEKWKELYFAIKVELDHLIQRTHYQEERVRWDIEEEEIIMELKAKDERIEVLEAKLELMEKQEHKREREMDILRQSLRIMCHTKEENNKFVQRHNFKTFS